MDDPWQQYRAVGIEAPKGVKHDQLIVPM